MPSDEVFITHFLAVSKGAANALIHLRVLEDIKAVNAVRKSNSLPMMSPTSPERVASVCALYRYVRAKLDNCGKSHLLPNIVHFEHLLCKVVRIIGSKGVKSYIVFKSPSFQDRPINKKAVSK